MANRRSKVVSTHADVWSRIVHADTIKYWDAVDFRAHVTNLNNSLLTRVFNDDNDIDFVTSERVGYRVRCISHFDTYTCLLQLLLLH